MLGYMSTINKEVLNEHLFKVHFLIGDFNVVAYNSILSQGWFKAGNGTASFSLKGTFIKERVNITRDEGSISMDNTIGCDLEKDLFKMQTLDLSSGIMDIYKGSITDGVLTFSNIDSGIKTKNEYGDWLTFKLIYKQISLLENELVVGCSKDNGKTWFPFLKNSYIRK